MTGTCRAILYSMDLLNHTCLYGLRAETLEEAGYEVEDCVLPSHEEVDAFQDENEVPTTPQIFVGRERIGESDELELHLIKEQSAV